jgi:signal transduction histidine kinase
MSLSIKPEQPNVALAHQSSKSALFVAIIIIAAVVSSAISYVYTTTSAGQIVSIASEDARSNAKIQAHDLSSLLSKQIESIAHNVGTIAAGKAIRSQDVPGAIPLLDTAQKSTSDLTSGYSWLDKDGKVLWSTSWANNATLRKQFEGSDFSYREYFSQPKQTLKPYYSTVFEGIDGAPRLTISYPILGIEVGEDNSFTSTNSFGGVIVAGMEVKSIGQFVQSQLSSDYKSSVGLTDRNGVILYSSSSTQNIGKSIFSEEIQSAIPSDIKDRFNQFIRDSLSGKSGSGDFSSQGKTSTIAYGPVDVSGNDFAVLYVVTSHELAGSAAALIDQQRIVNIITIAIIGAIAASLASAVAVWNKRLAKEIASKTSELIFANESLAESNNQLQVANSKLNQANEELVQAYEQMKIHDRLQVEFVNVAAHELRTPIQPLLGAADLLEQQFAGKEKIEVTRPEIEMILRNAKRLQRLSSDILEISRIESGALKLNREDFSLTYIIAEAIKDARAQSTFDPDKLTFIYNPDDIFVNADRDKITEVITNLLTNSIKFTKEGTISITTGRDPDKNAAIVQVKDTGSSIDLEVLPRLFEKFVTKSEKGTGIGLFISKKIIEAHGGAISGENNADGPGATFRFSLPLAQYNIEQGKDSDLAT